MHLHLQVLTEQMDRAYARCVEEVAALRTGKVAGLLYGSSGGGKPLGKVTQQEVLSQVEIHLYGGPSR